jgi:hypothetical protein
MKARHLFLISLCAMPLTLGAALADTRQDVRGASVRCDSITEDRAWLDCYYGAAQPMRAQLGLSPAPASQQELVPPAEAPPPARRGFFSRLWPF